MSAKERTPANEPHFDEQHEVFERCLREILTGRATIEECVQRYPHLAELAGLLGAALRAHQLPRPSMPVVARDQLRAEVLSRHRLLYETPDMAPAETPPAVPFWHRLPPLRLVLRPLFGVAIVVGLFFGGGVMLIQAARGTVPGEALYGLKLAVEYAELSLAEPQARPEMLEHIAQLRLDEVEVLRERGQIIPASTIFDATDHINAALLRAPTADDQLALYRDTVQELQRAVDTGLLGLGAARVAVESLEVPADMRVAATLSAPVADQGGDAADQPPIRPVLTVTSTPTPTLEPTRTRHPSHTPRPTDEPEPTRTLRPTHMPRPTDEPEPTRTLRPTHTPKPTDEPEPTRTPRPTHTPKPTDEPEPTRTPRPTRTVRPTHTPNNRGNSGNQGNSGNSGNQGNQGNSGNQGNQGNSGNPSNSGNQGNSGNSDNAEPPDNPRPPPDPGSQGNQGNQGNQGQGKN